MSKKHDVNVKKNSTVNFQIGLIASLLFVYLLFEMYTKIPPKFSKAPLDEIPEETIHTIDRFKVKKKKKTYKKKLAKTKQPVINKNLDNIEVDKNNKIVKAMDFGVTDDKQNNKPVKIEDIESISTDDTPVKVHFLKVERVPVFPGCESFESNAERAACFNEKVKKIVSRKFNTNLGNRYGLTGLQKIYSQFEVGIDGTIQNIKVRAPHPKLEEEAQRVIGLLPKMMPGMQRDTPVVVKFQLPINFKVE